MSNRGFDGYNYRRRPARSRADDARLGLLLVAGAAVLLAAVVLTVLQLFAADDVEATSGAATPSPSAPVPATEETEAPVDETPAPEDTEESTVEPEPDPGEGVPDPDVDTTPVERTAGVAVYNQSGIAGLAARTGQETTELGWTVTATSNWQGGVSQNTVYYSDGLYEQAILLAMDLGIEVVEVATAGMRPGQLTVILATDR